LRQDFHETKDQLLTVLKSLVQESDSKTGQLISQIQNKITALETRITEYEKRDGPEIVNERVSAAWNEVVSKKRPGLIPMESIIREQLQQQRLTEDRKANIIVYGLKANDAIPDKRLFMDIVTASNMGEVIKDANVDCQRLGKPVNDAVQPLRVTLSDAEMKSSLFKNLKHWRDKLRTKHGKDVPLPSLEHDLTREQRAEKKTLVAEARLLQGKLPENSLFRIRVRGPPERMKIVKIDQSGKWEQPDK
jgi:hypothetical protein